jgi:hypothetical protein
LPHHPDYCGFWPNCAFLASVFMAKKVYRSGEKQFSLAKEAFFLIGDVWLCAMEGKPLPANNHSHIAFS